MALRKFRYHCKKQNIEHFENNENTVVVLNGSPQGHFEHSGVQVGSNKHGGAMGIVKWFKDSIKISKTIISMMISMIKYHYII